MSFATLLCVGLDMVQHTGWSAVHTWWVVGVAGRVCVELLRGVFWWYSPVWFAACCAVGVQRKVRLMDPLIWVSLIQMRNRRRGSRAGLRRVRHP